MRVIAGSARGRRLVAPPGYEVRPTSDRLREALFASLGARTPGARVWDACAGTGAVAIEALSRGAAQAVLSEPALAARLAIERNLATTGFVARSRLLAVTWQRALSDLRGAGPCFDLIYYDPPYDVAEPAVFLAAAGTLLAPGGLIVLEHRRGRDPVPEPPLGIVKRLAAGKSAVSIVG